MLSLVPHPLRSVSCLLVTIKLVAVMGAMLVVDRVGRRLLLLVGSLLTASALAFAAIAISLGSAPLTIVSVGLTVV